VRSVVLALVLAAVPARAQSEPEQRGEEPSEATAVEEAPPPGAESGRLDQPSDGESAARTAGRTLLFVPRGVLELAMAPIRGSIWANERYHIAARVGSLLFNDARTFGVYPLVFFESTQGVLVGAQLETGFSRHDRLKLFAGVGPSRYRVDGKFRSTGHFDDHVAFTVYGEYDRQPNARFYGIGNADEVDTPLMPVDAFDEDIATLTYYEDRLARAAGIVDVRMSPATYISAAGAIAHRGRDESSRGPSTEAVFEPATLVDFDSYRAGYGELELRYDTRGPASTWQPRMVTSKGSLAAAYGGLETVEPGPTFWRYGVDLQHYILIGSGPRVIAGRFEVEGISAASDEVPFTELPALGGRAWLRGYPLDRFRDRVAVAGTAEYQWDLSRELYASLFVDVGRVYPALDDLTFDDLRCGYGIALEGHSHRSLLARVSIASSIDGGVFFNLYLDPISEIEPRVRRR